MDEFFEIAVVDDEEWVRRGLVSKLSKSGFSLSGIGEFADGDALLRHIENGGRPDILVCDIRMPGMDGLDLSVRAKTLLPGLQVIICSGYGEFDYARRAIQMGASEYLLKPIDDGEFLGSLKTCMESITLFRRNNERLSSLRIRLEKTEDPPREGKAGIVRAVAANIDEHFGEYLTLELFAADHRINPSYLSTIFKEIMGVNFQTYLSGVRIRNAKEYLASGRFRIGDVATKAGFSNRFYFSRAFKKIEGLSPREFMDTLSK